MIRRCEGKPSNAPFPVNHSRVLACSLALLAALSHRVRCRRPRGRRLLRDQDPPGTRREVPRVSTRARQEAQGRASSLDSRPPSARAGPRAGRRARRPGCEPALPGILRRRRVRADAPQRPSSPPSVVADLPPVDHHGAPDPREEQQPSQHCRLVRPEPRLVVAEAAPECHRFHPSTRPCPLGPEPIDAFVLAKLEGKKS